MSRQSIDIETAHDRAQVCRMLLRFETEIEKAMGATLAARPYWGPLVAIYLAEIDGRTLFQSCLTTDERRSKPHRRSARLAELGVLLRERDPHDHRRTDLRLAPATKGALDKAIGRILAVLKEIVPEIEGRDRPVLPLMPTGKLWYSMDDGTNSGLETMNIIRGKVIAGGRIALPADIRRSLGLESGDTVLFELEGDEVKIRPARSALRRVQDRLRSFAPQDGLVSEELIAERRAEASRD